MADNFLTVAPESTAPVALPVATKQLDDGYHAGAAVIVDATGARAKTLAINASGEAAVQMGADITNPTAMPAGGSGIRGWLSAIWTKLNGTLAVTNTPAVAESATLANVASSATNVTLLAANANRKGATIYNDSTAILYVKFGATASATSFVVAMAASSYYEFPQPVYVGIVDGLWSAANGSARVAEIA